jgi:hypothetical protein
MFGKSKVSDTFIGKSFSSAHLKNENKYIVDGMPDQYLTDLITG